MDGKTARARSGHFTRSDRTAPLKPKEGLNGPPARHRSRLDDPLGCRGITMKIMRRIAWLTSWAWIVTSSVFCQTYGKQPHHARVDKNTVVRIFYLPPESYLHPPLIFRVAGGSDPRLGTAPINILGRTPYISLSEMRNVVTALAEWNLSWRKSKRLETHKRIETREMTDKMEVSVFSSRSLLK